MFDPIYASASDIAAAMHKVFNHLLFMPYEAVNAESRGEPEPSLRAFMEVWHARERINRSWDAFLNDWDVLLAPVVGMVAPVRGAAETIVNGKALTAEEVEAVYTPSKIAPVTGLPIVVMPLGRTRAGLPFAVQLVGRRWQDLRLLAIAEQITEAAGGFVRPPDY